MIKALKKTDFSGFTKAELLKTIKTLDRRQTQLLNEIAKLQATVAATERPDAPPTKFNEAELRILATEIVTPLYSLGSDRPATDALDSMGSGGSYETESGNVVKPDALPNPYADISQPVAVEWTAPWKAEDFKS